MQQREGSTHLVENISLSDNVYDEWLCEELADRGHTRGVPSNYLLVELWEDIHDRGYFADRRPESVRRLKFNFLRHFPDVPKLAESGDDDP